MEFSSDSHYFIMKSGDDVILYNRFSKKYERWIIRNKSVKDISIIKSKDGVTYDIKDFVQKLEFQIPSPDILKLEEKDGVTFQSWIERYGPSSYFETNPPPEVIEEINSKIECACSKVSIEAELEEFIDPQVDRFAKTYVLGKIEEYIPPRVDNFAKSYVLGKVEEYIPPRVDNFAKSYVLGRLKKFIPPRVDNFAKSYVLGRLKKHIPPRIDNFAKSYVLGRLKKYVPPRIDNFAKSYVLAKLKKFIPPKVDNFAKSYVLARLKKFIPPKVDNFAKSYVLGRLKVHIPPKVDNFAKTYVLARLGKQRRDSSSVMFWKIVFICDEATPLSEAAVIHLRNDLPSFFYPAISKEDYIALKMQDDLMDILLSINGINKAATQSYRIYLEKSDNYFWEEIIDSIISKLTIFFRNYNSSELPGSRIVINDPSIRIFFNRKVPYTNILNNIYTKPSPKIFESSSKPTLVPQEQERFGQNGKIEEFKTRSNRIKGNILKGKVEYKWNPITKKWYKESIGSS